MERRRGGFSLVDGVFNDTSATSTFNAKPNTDGSSPCVSTSLPT